ncbi:MAG: nitroreductase family protein [Clostridia bacterium]|nr:nitroreductase family protein [Clostridia bacterium]
MNQTIKELMERKSVRVYTDREITAEEREAILNAAMAAPTAGNQQMYTIIDVRNQERKEKLAVLCDNQPFIASAKMVLIFCADFRKWYDAFREGGAEPRRPGLGDLMLGVSDANIAAQNAVTAAESLGIGSCYIGDIMENAEEMKEFMSLPEFVFPAAMLVFGYPTEQQKNRKKPERCRLEDIVCVDAYEVKDGKALRRLFKKETEDRGRSYESWAQAFCVRKYNSDFAKELSRSVKEYVKEWF